MRQIDNMTMEEIDVLKLNGMLKSDTVLAQAQHTPFTIGAATIEIKRLEGEIEHFGRCFDGEHSEHLKQLARAEQAESEHLKALKRCAYLESQRDEWRGKALASASKCDQSKAHAQRLADALTRLANFTERHHELDTEAALYVVSARETLAEWSKQK